MAVKRNELEMIGEWLSERRDAVAPERAKRLREQATPVMRGTERRALVEQIVGGGPGTLKSRGFWTQMADLVLGQPRLGPLPWVVGPVVGLLFYALFVYDDPVSTFAVEDKGLEYELVFHPSRMTAGPSEAKECLPLTRGGSYGFSLLPTDTPHTEELEATIYASTQDSPPKTIAEFSGKSFNRGIASVHVNVGGNDVDETGKMDLNLSNGKWTVFAVVGPPGLCEPYDASDECITTDEQCLLISD